MVDIQHEDLPDVRLHEPKGVASAINGAVYTANGVGSGAWSLSGNGVPNEVIISQLSDFPAPVSNVITLAADIVYRISGNVNIGDNRFVNAGTSAIVGNNQVFDIITSTTTGALWSSTGPSYRFDGVGMIAATGTIFNIVGDGTTTVFFENSFIGDCVSMGTASNFIIFSFRKSALLGSSLNGMLFSGTNGSLKIGDANFQDFTGTAINLGTATFVEVFIGSSVIIDIPSGATGLNVAASSANIAPGGRGFIFNSSFVGTGTAVTGLDSGDVLWDVIDTKGVSSTANGAQGNIIGNTVATAFSGGVDDIANKVAVNFNSSFTADITKRFTLSSAGILTCLSKEPKLYYVDTRIFASISGGASRQYRYLYVKNTANIVSSSITAEYDGSNPGANSASTLVELTDTDTLQLFVYAVTANTDLVVNTASMTIFAQS